MELKRPSSIITVDDAIAGIRRGGTGQAGIGAALRGGVALAGAADTAGMAGFGADPGIAGVGTVPGVAGVGTVRGVAVAGRDRGMILGLVRDVIFIPIDPAGTSMAAVGLHMVGGGGTSTSALLGLEAR